MSYMGGGDLIVRVSWSPEDLRRHGQVTESTATGMTPNVVVNGGLARKVEASPRLQPVRSTWS